MIALSIFARRVLILSAFIMNFSIVGVCTAQSTPPDLTAAGAIAALKTNASATPVYQNSFNLGPTGLRGWFHCRLDGIELPTTGRMTDASRQILITTASTPGDAVIAVDDIILGAIAANSGTVPPFDSDARKAFGTAITNAEKIGAGTLRVKRWRAGSVSDVNISIPTLGEYSATAPYNCPKSAAILSNTRSQVVSELIADPYYLNGNHSAAVNSLSLLASVPYAVNPADPNESGYSQVRARLQTYARSITVPAFQWQLDQQSYVWVPAYQLVFLAEYYLLTNDAQVIPTISGITRWLSEFQSMFGTFGHSPGKIYQDGSGRRTANGYGPVNACGNIANIAILLGKKALVAAGQPIDPKTDPAIQRATGFLSSYVNKGSIPYGEHMPGLWHASNGKDAAAAVFFGLQSGMAVQTEYYSRMSIAGWAGVEAGHTGQALGLLWAALGAGMGGEAAASAHFNQLLWRFDLTRRTNSTFTYDCFNDDYYSGTPTTDGTYLGDNPGGYGVKNTAIYLLTYSLPLKQLYITGKSFDTAYNLDPSKIANAVSAGSFRMDRATLSVPQLFMSLGDYDPLVRYNAAHSLAAKTLTSAELTDLRGLLSHSSPNTRQGAAETLGLLKDIVALPTLVGMLHGPSRDSDHWVRQKVGAAIAKYDTSDISAYRDALILAFIANSPANPETIDWADPFQFSNSILAEVIFTKLAAQTINAPKTTHLYPAIRAGLLLPAGFYRQPVAIFAKNRLNLTDLQNLFPELAATASADTPADRMFSGDARANALAFMVQNKITEGVGIAFAMFNEGDNGVSWGSGAYLAIALNALVSYGDAARYTLPRLKEVKALWDTRPWDGGLPHAQLRDTIAFLENVTASPPATNLGKCVATPQIVTTTGATSTSITLAGASPRGSFSFQKLTNPSNGILTGTAPNFTYTPNAGFTGTDKFTFQTNDSLTTSTPASVAIIVGSPGTGIVGNYFNNADFTSPVLSRTDAKIDFDWGTSSPDPSIEPDTFSARWSGYLLAPETGTYSLSSLSSDGVRAYLNGSQVINNLNDQVTRWTDGTSINLTAGQKVPLMLEYYENTGSAVAKLKWIGPTFAGVNGEIIPQEYLFTSNSSGGTDTSNPVISIFSPLNNATSVPHAADLIATFSENIVRGTGNITIRNITDNTQITIPVTDTTQIAVAGPSLIINPTTLLAGSKNYAIWIDATAIDDAAGNSFAGIATNSVWNFTTTIPDVIKPTPDPMTFAMPPLTTSATSITMTASTASDVSGVEYRFNNITLGTSSPWQNSPVLHATGLSPSTQYTFTVQARDRSAAANTTAASASASARTLSANTLDLMSLNLFGYGRFSSENHSAVTLEAGEFAGVGAYNVSGWQNYQVSGPRTSPAAPVNLTSNLGNLATFTLNDVRSGWTSDSFVNSNFGGSGDLMDSNANGTDHPYDETEKFDMTISNIPYSSYDLIVYLSANDEQFGTGTGKLILNGGAVQSFSLPRGEFSSFTEITNATTPGNYIVFQNLTSPTLNLKVWGNAFNNIGPAGFQIVNSGPDVAETIVPTISSYSPADNATAVAHDANFVATFSEPIVIGAGNITIKNLTDSTQTVITLPDSQVTVSGSVLTINPSANLAAGKNYSIQIAAGAVKDLANNNFAGIANDTTWNFSSQDTIAPTISSYNPADNATSVAVGANFVATFSEPIAIGTGNITIKNLTDNTQTTITLPNAQVTVSGSVLTINPTANLELGKNYSIQIAAGAVKDLANNNFAGYTDDTIWNFSSQPPAVVETIAPTISSYNPTDNATAVSVGANFVATFSEPIAIGTGNITIKNLTDNTQTTITLPNAQVTVSGSVLTINPTANLASGKNFSIQIAAGAVKDLVNNNFAGITDDTTWNFTAQPTAPIDGTWTFNGTNTANYKWWTATNWTSGRVATGVNSTAFFTLNITDNRTILLEGNRTIGNITFTDTTSSHNLTLSGSTLTLDVENGTPNINVTQAERTLSISSIIAGSYGMSKNGPGTLTLSGINTYSGTTTVNAGRLLINGSTSATSNFAVVGGDLGGSGTIAGNVTVATAGNLSPGASTGILNITGNLDVSAMAAGAGTLKFDLASLTGTNDRIVVGGNLTLGNLALDDLVVTNPSSLQTGTYTLITSAGLTGSVNGSSALLTAGLEGRLQITGNNLELVVGSDVSPPAPNPMTFASPPVATSSTTVAMTATTASDANGVEYRFHNVTLNTSSAWQDSPEYTATGLTASTSYSFTVQARDKSPAQNATHASASATATTQGTAAMDLMSLNFFAYGRFSSENHSAATLEAGESAGVGAYNVSGWQNYHIVGPQTSPAAPFTLTSSLGAAATFTLNDVRNGWTSDSNANANFGGSGDMMDSNANGTDHPYDETEKFDMTVSNIPYPTYDLIVYLTANDEQYENGTGKLILNGGAVQNFTLPRGEFSNFIEITNATTPGNYVVFRNLIAPTLTLKVWGNAFNNIGPAGFQIVKNSSSVSPPDPAVAYQTWLGRFTFPLNANTTPSGDSDGDTLSNEYEFAFGLNPTSGASVTPITPQINNETGIFNYTRTHNSGMTYKIYYSTNLSNWFHDSTAIQTPAAVVDGVETVTVTLGSTVQRGDNFFIRIEATSTP